jgi:hypothetical protein
LAGMFGKPIISDNDSRTSHRRPGDERR